jgi:hypothetical protein
MDVGDVTLMDSWAEEEFGAANLGDVRRTKRLIDLADTFAQRPSASLPDAAQDPARLKAAYRFFDCDAIEPQAMLASHIAATHDRCASVPLVLAVQDTSELDWSDHPATTGLGPIHTKNHRGLLMHTTLAFSPERVPLGLLHQQVWARDPQTFGTLPDQHTRPFADKESYRWARGLEAINAARDACPDTHFVMLADAEADIYDLLVTERREGVEVLIRAGQNRRITHPEARLLWAALPQGRWAGTQQVHVPARKGQAARTAEVSIRYQEVCIKPPKYRASEGLAEVRVWVVWVVEEAPPAGVEPLEWLLLTSVRVESEQAARTIVRWYTGRWGIEVWHKTLKSGCTIEKRQLETGKRLQRCVALFSVIAWRVMFTTMLARAVPEVACTAVLDDDEWQAVYCHMKRTVELPEKPPTLREAVRWIARLGGFQGRKGDGEPGVMVMWKGFQHLADLTAMYCLFRRSFTNQHVGND